MYACNNQYHIILFRLRFENGKSDKEILDNLLDPSRYDKRLLPPVDGKYFYRVLKRKNINAVTREK